MARPRNDTKLQIVFRGKIYTFKGYAPNMVRAVEKAGNNLTKAQFLNTGQGSEVAIYIY